MKTKLLQADAMLMVTAIIWGFAFVAQQVGMDHIGPYTFIAVRFLIGSLSMIPVILWLGKGRVDKVDNEQHRIAGLPLWLWGSAGVGTLLFIGSALQQVGLLYTTVGNAAFITGLYVLFVPIIGVVLRHKIGAPVWFGCVFAVMGLGLLTLDSSLTVNKGDLLNLMGAVIWASHVLFTDWLVDRVNAVKLATAQFIFCTFWSMIAAFALETPEIDSIMKAIIPLLYVGILSTGVAFTLQAVAQQHAPPAIIAILLSTEAIFAVIGGWWLLDETLNTQQLVGCSLMLAGILIPQLIRPRPDQPNHSPLG